MKFTNANKKNKKFLFIYTLVFLVLNILFLMAGRDYLPYNILLIGSISIGLLMSIIKIISSRKRVNNLLKLLYVELDPDKFISETQLMINKYNYRDNTKKSYYYILQAMGNAAKGEYKKNIDIYENDIIYVGIPKNKAILYNNLLINYCLIGDLDKAIHTYTEGEKYINMYINEPKVSGSIMLTLGILEYLKGNLKVSEDMLENSKIQKIQQIRKCQFNAVVDIYLAKIYIQTNRLKEARLLMEYNLSQKLLPDRLFKTKEVLNQIEEIEKKNN